MVNLLKVVRAMSKQVIQYRNDCRRQNQNRIRPFGL